MALQTAFRRHCHQRPVFGTTSRRSVPAARCHQGHAGRRKLLQLGIALPFLAAGPGFADVVGTPESAPVPAPALDPAPAASQQGASSAAPAPAQAPSPQAAGKASEPFLEVEFQLVPPPAFGFVDTQPAYDPDRRGPAPEPSPVKARFDSADGAASVSVLVRSAQSVKPSLLQVTDISVFGGLEEVARLLLPRGSRVLAASELKVVLPPKQTALGPVELPPKCYYRYEFTTNNGLHVAMTVAALRGKVYVCGGSVSASRWEQYGGALRSAAESFRLRSDGAVL